MSQQHHGHQHEGKDRQYGETVDPKNPPNSVLRPEVRRATLSTFLGGIIVFFAIVGAALIYWTASNRHIDPDPGAREQQNQDQVGTAGNQPDSTRDEIEFRGADGSSRALPLTEIDAILDDRPGTAIGRRVDLHQVDVASAERGSFWIHDGNAKVEVVAPADTPAVRPGQVVDVSGALESDGRGGVRIRAERVQAR